MPSPPRRLHRPAVPCETLESDRTRQLSLMSLLAVGGVFKGSEEWSRVHKRRVESLISHRQCLGVRGFAYVAGCPSLDSI
ncbi:hypothetical protein DL93DRAFT_2072648 [Clavulina sp. PMI_390]|nr:hypothetical protein DL93DRAFT_2072648 [Clavulina sp. PMI_390]